ncbi:MAG TPA: hypothetical protein DCS07_01870 [Bdellovibrionales bacterium]|nr:MAG: hypothetical protein A2Z97_00190 [Bdellovibrionales bacterium GWB1_52_6]OFZ04092.1 MAG: hypothetical protein A2X97_14925 [Bdellovibrionales bacterium GWA1_52_35]OFZ35736.1 MAG: hypothetical protein A2070_06050 [Bdellovibrionales bacterium GWC1_52_8]HAR41372.1 hypothetical protein [Bdellovibrionales bacterium]HCM39822.1 hypothetical protein [Bdellovibrionales bacterium]
MTEVRVDLLIAALLGGPALIGWGMINYKKKQLIDNTPRSKVRSASMGMIELKGFAEPWKKIQAPVSGSECCWWRCKIEKHVRSGKSSRWQTIKQVDSVLPLYLVDETGRILVDPSGAEVDAISKTQPCTGSEPYFTTMGVLKQTGFLSLFDIGSRYRVTEERIPIQAPLYVLGELMQRAEALEARRQRYQDMIRAVKKDSVKMAVVDTNKDGVVDGHEWDVYRAQLEAQFILEEEKRAAGEDKLIVRLPRNSEPFILSVHEEKSLSSKYALLAFGLIPLGIAASGFGVFYGLSIGIPQTQMILGWLACTMLGLRLSFSLRGPARRWAAKLGVLR